MNNLVISFNQNISPKTNINNNVYGINNQLNLNNNINNTIKSNICTKQCVDGKYEGEMKNGLFDGKGKIVLQTNQVYEGSFVQTIP